MQNLKKNRYNDLKNKKKKKNTKVYSTTIPGLNHWSKQTSGPLITKQHVQAKFVAKYNKEKQQKASQT